MFNMSLASVRVIWHESRLKIRPFWGWVWNVLGGVDRGEGILDSELCSDGGGVGDGGVWGIEFLQLLVL